LPIISIQNREGIAPAVKEKLAQEITAVVHGAIRSPHDLISVVFADHAPESIYRNGSPTAETVIFCYIRKGRSDGAVQSLLAGISEVFSRLTEVPEDEVELSVIEIEAKFTMRGGQRLPEPPYA
jgi:phenylpyruvate tautomerase PptA (4-oxalocrotonate tautomerase family)